MLVDKLTQQMQLNCIITQIDFVLAFEMYRYLVASLSRKSSESKNLSISLKNKENVSQNQRKMQPFDWNPKWFINVQYIDIIQY